MQNRTFKVRDLRKKGFFMVDDAYLNGYAKNLDPHATCVYLSLCRHADVGQRSFPSVELIAKQHRISERTVVRKIALLNKHNLIKIEKTRRNGGTFKSNTYFLLDKSMWKDYQVTQSHMAPSDFDDINQVTQSHPKETQVEGNTVNIGDESPNLEKIELPDHIKNKIGNPSKNITKTYQEQAFRFAKNLKIDLEEASKKDKTIKGRWIGAFKRGANVNGAYSKCYDSEEFNRRDDLGKIYYFFKVL